MLALLSGGSGSVLSTLHQNAREEIGTLLKIPRSFTQMAMVPAGCIKGSAPKSAVRPPVDEIVYGKRLCRTSDAHMAALSGTTGIAGRLDQAPLSPSQGR